MYAFDEHCDLRKSIDTLPARVTERMGRQVLPADLFLFFGRDPGRAKVLYFDRIAIRSGSLAGGRRRAVHVRWRCFERQPWLVEEAK